MSSGGEGSLGRAARKVIIVGGGIAGLATARALQERRVGEIVVLERSGSPTERGAGVQLTNNACRSLSYLGLLKDVRGKAVECKGCIYQDLLSGSEIFRTPAGEYAVRRYGYPYLQIHRQELQRILYESLESVQVKFGSECATLEQDGASVTVSTTTGDTYSGDILIGADGIQSTVRGTLWHSEMPSFSGILGWRGLIEGSCLSGLGLDRFQYSWWGLDRSVVCYWVNGGRSLNFLGLVPANEVVRESWATVGDTTDMCESFKGSCDAVRAIVEAVRNPFLTGYYDRPPLKKLIKGRVALVGDAAHPLWAFLANGAGQSIEDAVVVAHEIDRNREASVSRALSAYEDRRLTRVTMVQERSREMGGICHPGTAERAAERNKKLAARAREDPTGSWMRDWLWGYDVMAQ